MKQFVFDIEANGLNPDKVWVHLYPRSRLRYRCTLGTP